MYDPGYERLLRNALQTELTLRMRHAMMHALRSPAQTILSALSLLQKKAAAGDTADLAKYADWIKAAASDLSRRAELVLPPRSDEVSGCDLRALTADVLHMMRDDAALKEVMFEFDAGSAPAPVACAPGELQLALKAILFEVMDGASAGDTIDISLDSPAGRQQWIARIPGTNKPSPAAFEPRFDVTPPQSGIAWHVARGIAVERGGALEIGDDAKGWSVILELPAQTS